MGWIDLDSAEQRVYDAVSEWEKVAVGEEVAALVFAVRQAMAAADAVRGGARPSRLNQLEDSLLPFRPRRTSTHDPDECSRQAAYHGRLDGRREMAEAAVGQLIARSTLGGWEIAEIRQNLLDLVHSLPLRAVR